MIKPLLLKSNADITQRYPALARQAAELSRLYKDRNMLVTDEALQKIGSTLWYLIDADEALADAKEQAGKHTLPVVLASNDPAVQKLPWETLYHPEYGFLAHHEGFTFSRTIPSVKKELPDIQQGPLRILHFSSLPDDLTEKEQLKIEEEQATVLETLGKWRQSGHVVLEMPDDGRFSEFKRLLQSFQPHLVYLSGHGKFKQDVVNNTAEGYFDFEDDESGNRKEISEKEIAAAFTGMKVQAVILSACQSGKATSDSFTTGLMNCLAQQGIPHVIGMRESIRDRAAIQFARAFFSALMKKQGIADALQHARQAIMQLQEDGQWCLPTLLSHQHNRPLLDWEFTPQPMQAVNNDISLSTQFIGRRRELRQMQRALREGTIRACLLTGAGGIGKTALADKLLNTLKSDGYEEFAFSARTEHDWHNSLPQTYKSKYAEVQKLYDNTAKQAEEFIKFLLEQHKHKVVLFFDNLQSLQNNTTCELNDEKLQVLIDAALRVQQAEAIAHKKNGLRLLLTSRWALPNWDNSLVYPLGKPVYRDFLAVAQQQKLPSNFFKDDNEQPDYKRLHQAYNELGGNFRALELFAVALQRINVVEEQAFLDSLKSAQELMQTNMLVEKVWNYRSKEEQELLCALTAYQETVAVDGVKALQLPTIHNSEALLHSLVAVSLVERYENKYWDVAEEFLVSPLVRDWLTKQGFLPVSTELLQQAANYHLWLLKHKRQTLEQATTTHSALMAAGMSEEAHRITLDWIVGLMRIAGLHQSLLNKWLLPACKSGDEKILSEALGQAGTQYFHLGQYDNALNYFNNSLAICQRTGEKSHEISVLNNIGLIYNTRGHYNEALNFYQKSLNIALQTEKGEEISTTLNNIAQIVRIQQGNNHQALKYLNQALNIVQSVGNKLAEGKILDNIGQIYYYRGENEIALKYFKESLSIKRAIIDKQGEGVTLNNLAQIYRRCGKYDDALCCLEDSIKIAQNFKDKSGEWETLSNIGGIYRAWAKYDRAMEYVQKALIIVQDINDIRGEGQMLNNFGAISQYLGNDQKALEYFEKALSIRKKLRDKSGQATTLNNIAALCYPNKDYKKALIFFKQALIIQQEILDKSGEGRTLGNIGVTYQDQGDYETAFDYLTQALIIQQDINDKAEEGRTHNNISQYYHAQRNYDKALEHSQKALIIQQEIGDDKGIEITLNNIAGNYAVQRNYDKAVEHWQQALIIQQKIIDKKGECIALKNIADTYAIQSKYDKALEYLKRLLTIQQEIGDKKSEGTTLHNITEIYHHQGDDKAAFNYLQRLLDIVDEIGDKEKGSALHNISQIYHAQRDYKTAFNYLKQALEIQQKIEDKVGEGRTLYSISQIYHAQGDNDTELDYLNQALAIQKKTGDKVGEASTRNSISQIYHDRGDYDTALDDLKHSLAIKQESRDKKGEGIALSNISQIYHDRGDYDTAHDYLKQALEIQQEIGDKSGESITLDNISAIYQDQADYDTALDYSKRSLAIQQEISDIEGLCRTFFNMGHIFAQNNNSRDAKLAWVVVYLLAKKIGYTKALQKLANLPPQIGLAGWEKLAKHTDTSDLERMLSELDATYISNALSLDSVHSHEKDGLFGKIRSILGLILR